LKSEIKAFIGHHVLDSHDFTFLSDEVERGALWFSLPIILWDNGIHLFSSSRFNHGEAVAESNGNFYVINHHDGKIYKTDASGTLTEGADGYPTNGRPIDFSITRQFSRS
jgi:F-type H+-transporting ATPase subunit a